jgi:hypothetical protein
MIDRREILEAASSFSLLPNVVEKDYVLGWILAGIDAHEELAESWVFKGGTCLKKCYFETYRFSEDQRARLSWRCKDAGACHPSSLWPGLSCLKFAGQRSASRG